MDHFHYVNGRYHAEEVAIEALAAQFGTPFYCYSTATLSRHYNVFAGHFSDLDTKICFAVKANGNLGVLATLAKLGAGADVVSEGEIRLALAAGIAPFDIVFSGVGKTRREMEFALEKNIFQFNVESEPELALLNEAAMSRGVKARVAIRVNPDVDSKTHAKISTGHKESKFGVSMEEGLALYGKAAAMPGIIVQGVSVHIGSQLTKIEPFSEAFSRLRAFVLELKRYGVLLTTIDVGGGIGIVYGEESPPLLDEYAKVVRREVGDLGCMLIFEPGRVLVGNAGILVSRVIYVKKSGDRVFVIVDAAMNDLIRPTLYGAFHDIVPAVAPPKDAKTEAVDVVGPVCESGDVFAEQRKMALPKAGDLLAFRSAGAYGSSMASNYNARPHAAEIMVRGKDFALTRPRQEYDTLTGASKRPGWL